MNLLLEKFYSAFLCTRRFSNYEHAISFNVEVDILKFFLLGELCLSKQDVK